MPRARIATNSVTESLRDLPVGSSVTVLFNGKQFEATILRRKPQSADIVYSDGFFENNIALDRITSVSAEARSSARSKI